MVRRPVTVLSLLLLLSCSTVYAQTPPEGGAASLPGELAWEELLQGNHEFIEGRSFCYDDIAARRVALAKKQSPRVTIVACADSRVAPELLFHQGLGDLFTIRTAGNVVDDFAIASIEYAAAHEWTSLIVVLGHMSCGGVGSALEPKDPPTTALQTLVNRIRESFDDDVVYTSEPTPEQMRAAVAANARHVAAYISAHSPLLRERIRTGQIQVIAAYQDLATGEVTRVD